ncbi:MAG: DUF2877 domain-containing protein [Rectinemataceae bacterium]
MTGFLARWAACDLFDRGGPVRLCVTSLHNHVMNLQVDEWNHMLMLADPEMYRGPASAGLDMPDFRTLQRCVKPGDTGCFRDGRIEFYGESGISVSLSAAERISFSVPSIVEFDRASVAAAGVAKTMTELAAPHLCSCLFADSGVDDLFRETIRHEFPRLLQSLSQGNQAGFEDSCSSLVGLGYGSTPTGDDLIHGALIALHYLRQATDSDIPLPSMPRSMGEKTTLLGAHMLEMGRRGLTPEPIRDFALNLLAGKPLPPPLAGIRRMGSDSGCTTAVGFYLMVLACRDLSARDFGRYGRF